MPEIHLCDIVNAIMKLRGDGSVHAAIVLPENPKF